MTQDPSSLRDLLMFSLQNGIIYQCFQTSNSHLVNEWQKRARWNELKLIVKERV